MKQLQEAFDALLPTDEQEERMLCKILVARDGAPRRHMRGNPVRMAVLAAAALALCVVTASAAEALGVSQMIRSYFQQKDEVSVMDKLNVAASGLNTTTADGWKFTITDLFGDSNRIMVGVTLEAPAGTILDKSDYNLLLTTHGTPHTLPPDEMKHYQTAVNRFGEENYSQPGYLQNDLMTADQVPDDNPKDNKISFVFDERLDYYQDGITVDFYFNQLRRYPVVGTEEVRPGVMEDVTEDVTEEIIVKEFDAKIANVTTRFSSNGYHLTPNTSVKAFGEDAAVSRLSFTPLSVSFELTGDSVSRIFFDSSGDGKEAILNERRPTRKERYQRWRETNMQIDPETHQMKPMEEKAVNDWGDSDWYGWTDAWELDTPLVLHFKDGTSQELDLFRSSRANTDKDTDEKKLLASYQFAAPLDLDTIDYITICDVRIALSAEMIK